MPEPLRTFSVLLVACLALAGVSRADAHEVEHPRVLVVTPKPTGLEIRVSEMWPAGESSNSFRRTFDADHDRMLSYEEQERLRQAAAETAISHIQVGHGGEPVELVRVATKLRGAVKVEAAAELSVDVGLWVALPADDDGRLEVTLSDWRSDDHDVEAVVTVPEGVELLETSLGKHDARKRLVTGVVLTKQEPLKLLWSGSRSPKGASPTRDRSPATAQ